MNMPFFVGFGFFFVALTAALVAVNRWAVRKRWYYLKMAVWCAGFMLLGYSTYFTTMIRSNADPGVDMYNVDNPVSLEGYLSREQYGDWPILYGPDFEDQAPRVDAGPLYVKGKEKYEVAGRLSDRIGTILPLPISFRGCGTPAMTGTNEQPISPFRG